MYLKRLTGIQRIYSSILVARFRSDHENNPHPHGIENGWIWLSNFLNLAPIGIPDICPTLILEFLEIAGHEMWKTYEKQFKKLLLVMHQHYLPLIAKVSIDIIEFMTPGVQGK